MRVSAEKGDRVPCHVVDIRARSAFRPQSTDFFSDLAGKAIHALGYQAPVPHHEPSPAGRYIVLHISVTFLHDRRVEGEDRARESFIRYAQYVSMFTQLLAGPIVKAREYLPALKERANHFIADHGHFTAALFLILTGLAKGAG